MKSNELVDFVIDAYLNGWGYVMTANGELYTEELAKDWVKRSAHYAHAGWYAAGKTKAQYFLEGCARWFGHHVADCSGLIVAAMRSENSAYGDRTADAFKAQFVQSGLISTLPEIPGLALWSSGHIGIYIGGGYAIEAQGYTHGVVRTKVSDRSWTRWGMLRDVDYGGGGEVMLQRGSKGPEVGAWQRALKLVDHADLGTYGPNKDGVDEDFGSKTVAATETFQRARKLSVTGRVDNATMAAMFDALGSRTSPTADVEALRAKVLAGQKAVAEAAKVLA